MKSTYLRLFLFAVFTGSTFHLAQYSTAYFSVTGAAAWRFGLAAVLMLVLLAVKEGVRWEAFRANGWAYFALGVIGIFGSNALFFWGLKDTSALNASLIMATNPLVTTLLAMVLLREGIRRREWIGVWFSVVGVVLVITQGSWEVLRGFAFAKGDLLLLLTNFAWALYGVLGRKYVKSGSTLATTSYTMVIGALCLVLVALQTPAPTPLADIPFSAWGAVAFMAVFTTVLGYLWWNQGIEQVGVSRTSVFFNLVPVVTLALSAGLGEPLTWVQGAGGLLVFTGVLISANSETNLISYKERGLSQ